MTRIFVCSLVVIAGCQKALPARLNVDQNVDVPSLSSKTLEIPAQAKEQKVRVTAVSSSGNFTIYVALQKDVPAIDKAIQDLDTPKADLLAKKEKTKEASLTFSVPANSPFAVVLANSGNSDLAVRVKVVPE